MNNSHLRTIKQISLITTFRCNAGCNMCNIWQHPTLPQQEIAPSYYANIPSGYRINITGGEPMVREDIEEVIQILYPKASLLELSTNGYFTEKIIRIAERHPNMLIRISLEGLPLVNDTKRGIKDGFDHALRTMLELKKTKCKNIGFSVVISNDNCADLLNLYELCVALDVELGNSVVHNSWYFHKEDNPIKGVQALEAHQQFVEALLRSKRRSLRSKIKDYARAYFNRSIHKRLSSDLSNYRPPCGALSNFIFIDPFGNVSPCNGSAEKWVLGNITQQPLEEILQIDTSQAILRKTSRCNRNCTFVVTERRDMVMRPWIPLTWIAKNKLRLIQNRPIKW